MSWAREVKDELCRRPIPGRDAALALLAGILRQGTAVDLGEARGVLVTLPSESPASARLVFNLLHDHAGVRPDVLVRRDGKGARHLPRFEYLFRDRRKVAGLGMKIGLVPGRRLDLPPALVATSQRRRHFLRGAFLAAGSLNAPSRAPHLELTFPNAALADEVRSVMERRNIVPLLQRRRGQVRLYLKSREAIAQFLRDVDAPEALFAFENAWAIREMRDVVNRLVNAETANLDKTVAAAMRQERAVRLLQDAGRLADMSPGLREMALLRLQYPDLTLRELGEHLGLSKSGANHRMRRLVALAESLLRGRG